MTTTVRMSEQEFLTTLADELPSYEFINGEVIQKPLTKRTHFTVGKRLAKLFDRYEEEFGGLSGQEPTVNVSAPPARVYRVPDLAYWAPGRPTGDEVFLPPTLVIEILSPGQVLAVQAEKCRDFRRAGVDVCWLIDPANQRILIFEDQADGNPLPANAPLQSRHLPGLSIDISALFAPPR